VARNVVVFPYWLENGRSSLMSETELKKLFPLGWAYLKSNQSALESREKGRFADSWYCFGRPQNLNEFEAVKIMTPDICDGPQMTIDISGTMYHTTTLYSFIFEDAIQASPKYFLGLLNSRVLWYFLRNTGTLLRGGYLRFKTEYLKPFPIPESTLEQRRPIETLVDYVLYLKAHPPQGDSTGKAQRQLMESFLEHLVDGLVYELYFPEEFSSTALRLSRLLTPDVLPSFSNLKGEEVERVFRRLFDKDHPVRQAVFFLEKIETVRIIQGETA
jgi:hypothetical protein